MPHNSKYKYLQYLIYKVVERNKSLLLPTNLPGQTTRSVCTLWGSWQSKNLNYKDETDNSIQSGTLTSSYKFDTDKNFHTASVDFL